MMMRKERHLLFLLYFFFIKIKKSSVQRERGAYVCELFLIKKLAGS
jgi:hypothetical protein